MKNCLVVDDSRVIRKVACRILEDLHFHVDEARTASPRSAPAARACRS